MNLTKTEKITGIALATVLLLLTLSGSGYFFFTLKVTFVQWLAYNACSPSSLVYLACFIAFWLTKKTVWLPLAFLPMYYFGTMGLFTFTWSGANIFAQMSHITMTLNLIWTGYVLYRISDYKAFAQGLLWSIALFVPYIAFVMYYCRTHAEEINSLLQMTP
ncbi:hypothetical protein [Capnocytophaga sp. oral taxon 338]|uniref:hypothetical protein n=1 Tax=Capnocytophaga sp. oral taxon 338 TaxID=710239 RepID=UPI000202E499|nr:hypothetical protein [Capnocytophaga sp. oral taxon 338]EGD34952.1 hypothetical protein HMPREF9071_0504 [Capnocytophaga sp. oral taxon 338 str. F0234]